MPEASNIKTAETEENIFYENDIKKVNVLDPEDTEMNRKNPPDSLRADVHIYSASVEAKQVFGSALQ